MTKVNNKNINKNNYVTFGKVIRALEENKAGKGIIR